MSPTKPKKDIYILLKLLIGIHTNLDNLIDSRVLWQIEIVFLSDVLGQEPAADKVSATVPFHARLGGRQADERAGHKLGPGAFLGRAGGDVPRAGGVDAQHGHLGLLHLVDDGWEGLAQGTPEGEAEDGVDDEVGGFQGLGEVGDEGYV